MQQTLTQRTEQMVVATRGEGIYDITEKIAKWVGEEGLEEGRLLLFIRHTSASLTIQENADPSVLVDLAEFLNRIVPQSPRYHHNTEGADDMPAHIKSMLTATELTIPVRDGVMMLGTWQGIYLLEHRLRAHDRKIVLQFIGTTKAS